MDIGTPWGILSLRDLAVCTPCSEVISSPGRGILAKSQAGPRETH